jgi:hypothetical protein
MGFSLYRVSADYKEQDGHVIGPAWMCHTRSEAEKIFHRCHYDPKLTNIKLELKTYGIQDQ